MAKKKESMVNVRIPKSLAEKISVIGRKNRRTREGQIAVMLEDVLDGNVDCELYWTTYKTKNFTFSSYGKTSGECMTAMLEGLQEHCFEKNIIHLFPSHAAIARKTTPVKVSRAKFFRNMAEVEIK